MKDKSLFDPTDIRDALKMRTTSLTALLLLVSGCSGSKEVPAPAQDPPSARQAASGPSEADQDMSTAMSEASTMAGTATTHTGMSTMSEASVGTADTTSTQGRHPSMRPRVNHQSAEARRVRALIKDGRRLHRAGNSSEALVKFEEALELNPGSSRLKCETGFVAFKARNNERADELLSSVVWSLPPNQRILPAMRVPTAMCLYNAGLAFQARERINDARTVWERSLELRPNRVVQAKLDALPPRIDPNEPVEIDIAQPIADVNIERIIKRLACDDPFHICECDEIEVSRSEQVVEEGGFFAAIYGAQCSYMSDSDWAVASSGGHTIVRFIGGESSTGAAGTSHEVDGTIHSRSVIAGGAPELVYEFRANFNDADMGICADNGHYESSIVVCSASPLRCSKLPRSAGSYSTTTCPCFEDEESDEACGEDDGKSGYNLEVTVEEGFVNVEVSPNERRADMEFDEGGVNLESYLGRSAIGPWLERFEITVEGTLPD